VRSSEAVPQMSNLNKKERGVNLEQLPRDLRLIRCIWEIGKGILGRIYTSTRCDASLGDSGSQVVSPPKTQVPSRSLKGKGPFSDTRLGIFLILIRMNYLPTSGSQQKTTRFLSMESNDKGDTGKGLRIPSFFPCSLQLPWGVHLFRSF